MYWSEKKNYKCFVEFIFEHFNWLKLLKSKETKLSLWYYDTNFLSITLTDVMN